MLRSIQYDRQMPLTAADSHFVNGESLEVSREDVAERPRSDALDKELKSGLI